MSDRDKQSEMDRRAEAYWIEGDKHSDIAYKQGWADALKHAREVQGLIDALCFILENSWCGCRPAPTDIPCKGHKALTAYQKAIEGE